MPIWRSCSYATLLRKCHEELPVLHVILSMRLERLSGTEGVLGAYPHSWQPKRRDHVLFHQHHSPFATRMRGSITP